MSSDTCKSLKDNGLDPEFILLQLSILESELWDLEKSEETAATFGKRIGKMKLLIKSVHEHWMNWAQGESQKHWDAQD